MDHKPLTGRAISLLTRKWGVRIFPDAHFSALKTFRGILQADGYAAFQGLYDPEHEPLVEAACVAHARRKFFDLHAVAPMIALPAGMQVWLAAGAFRALDP